MNENINSDVGTYTKKFVVPLHFWFTKNPGLYLPISAIAAPSLNQYFDLAQARSDLDINCPAIASCTIVALSSISWFVPCSKLNDNVLIAVNAFRLPTALVKDIFPSLFFNEILCTVGDEHSEKKLIEMLSLAYNQFL